MGKFNYLATKMKSDPAAMVLMVSDFQDFRNAARSLASHAAALAGGLGITTSVFKWLAFVASVYLFILHRTKWKSNIRTSLLIPYIFFSLPTLLFSLFRGRVGQWAAVVAITVRLFFRERFPGIYSLPDDQVSTVLRDADWLELPGALILLTVVAPIVLADTVRGDWIGFTICLGIAIYLLQEHIRASGGFKNAFRQSHGLFNSIGILMLLVYPIWALIVGFV